MIQFERGSAIDIYRPGIRKGNERYNGGTEDIAADRWKKSLESTLRSVDLLKWERGRSSFKVG